MKVNKAAIERYSYPEEEFLTLSTRELLQATELKKFDAQFYQNDTGKPKRHGIIHSGIWKHQNKKHELIYADITSEDVDLTANAGLWLPLTAQKKRGYREEANWIKNNLEGTLLLT